MQFPPSSIQASHTWTIRTHLLNQKYPDSCITVAGACFTACHKNIQWMSRAAEKITGAPLPSVQEIYNTWLTHEALCIVGDPSHPSPSFFSQLPPGRRRQSQHTRTSRLQASSTRLSWSSTLLDNKTDFDLTLKNLVYFIANCCHTPHHSNISEILR